MKLAYQTVGFGYDPTDVYAFYTVKEGRDYAELFQHANGKTYREANISAPVWSAVKKGVEVRFNQTLKGNKLKVGHFKKGETEVCRLLGKELGVLFFALEFVSDPDEADLAMHRWLGYSREELWWLYTMSRNNKGWRKALYFVLADKEG